MTRKMHNLKLSQYIALLVIVRTSCMGLVASSQGQSPPMLVNWTWGPVMPHAQCAFGTSATASGVVTVGGTYWSASAAKEPVKHWLSTVCMLDPATKAWKSLPSYPVAIGYPLVVSVGNLVYAVGGRNEHGALRDMYTLDLAAPEPGWHRGCELPCPLSRLRGGVWNTVIYAVSDEIATAPDRDATFRGKVLSLDTSNRDCEWTVVAELPKPQVGYRAAALCAGKLYLFGGGLPLANGGMQLQSDVWALDLAHRTWHRKAPLPFRSRDASTAIVGDRYVLLVGGVEQAAAPTNTPDGQERIILTNRGLLYETKTDRYFPLAPLRLAVADHGLAVIGKTIYVVGGEDSPYRTRTDLVQEGALSEPSGHDTPAEVEAK